MAASWHTVLGELAARLDAQEQLLDAAEQGRVEPDVVGALAGFRPPDDLPRLPRDLAEQAAVLHARCVAAAQRAEQLVQRRPTRRSAHHPRGTHRSAPTHVDMRA